MEKATISELKNRLSAYLAKVKAGHAVVVFERNRPVARIERVESGAPGDERLARLERAGLLRQAKHPLSLKVLQRTPPKSKKSVVQALLDERREER
jgi:prevent-host-death family protein